MHVMPSSNREHFTRPIVYLMTWVFAILATSSSVMSLGIYVTRPRPAVTLTPLAITFIVTNKNNDGPGSLRQAILDANSIPGRDTISFNIPGQGVQTISLTFALPTITDPVIIDGATQPGFSGTPIIELNGAGGNLDAFSITAGNSTVRSLVINRFQRGIFLSGGGGNTILGNFIGTDSTGTAALPNLVGISVTSPDNTIGGAAAGSRNVISANDTNISIDGPTATGNRVLGNHIGTNAAGTARPTGFVIGRFGVIISAASNNFIGGAGTNERNVISGHANDGIRIENGTGNQVLGNFIGTAADGSLALVNALVGVRILGSTNNVIGGSASGAGNIIGYNFVGVSIECNASCSVGNAIPGNSIFSNTSLGIDLANDRNPAPNDAGDLDTGANNLQNYPIITSAKVNAGGTTITGTLNSTANTTFRIEFFANGACDPSGHGEGALYFGSTTATTDASGNVSFSASFPNALPAGQVITATATDPAGNTSEFSACATGGASGSVGFSTFNYFVFEDESNATITVIRQGGSSGSLAVNYATSDMTATAGQDYVATAGTLTFADGETNKTIIIPLLTDTISESTEDVSLTLSRATGAPPDSVNTSNRAVLSIHDSGQLPLLYIDCGNVGEICLPVSVVEGNAGVTNAVFTVRLSGDTRGKTVSADFETTGVTATSGTDFQHTAGTIIFPPGVTTQTVTVPVNGDTLDESDETFKLVLKNLSNAVLSSEGDGGGLIIDDDAPPGLSVADIVVAEKDEGTTTVTFTVNLSGASGRAVTASFATSDGTATTAGSDYTAVSGTLTFDPGEVTKTINVAINGDTTNEQNETFFVTLTEPSNATLARAQGTGIILNDDQLLLLTEEGSDRAIALESMMMIRGPFPTEIPYGTAADKRTRIVLFAGNLELQPGESFTVLEAHAEDSRGTYPLTVEFVGKVPDLNLLTQVNVRLADELIGGADVRVHIKLRGMISNKVIISLKANP